MSDHVDPNAILNAARERFTSPAGSFVQPPPPTELPPGEILLATLTAEEQAYIARFHRSSKGNLTLRGWIIDTQTDGHPAATFQLTIFTSNGGDVPLDKWTWGIAIDGSDTMEYSNVSYPNAQTAALSARAQLLAGGLSFGDESSVLVGIRARIKAASIRRNQD